MDLTTPQNLWAGKYGEQKQGDDPVQNQKFGRGIRNNALTNANFEKLLAQYAQGQPQLAVSNQQSAISSFDFTQFFADNKWLILGALGIGAYFLFSGGLGASDRTVTSVTRYSPKASK